MALSESTSLDPRSTALLVMDYQNVLLENYLSKEDATSTVQQTSLLLEAARSAGILVIYVKVAFRAGYPEVSPRNKLFMMIKDNDLFAHESEGTNIPVDVAPQAGDLVVIKHRVSAFSGADLELLLRSRSITTLILAGITTGGVTLSTVRHAFDLDYGLVVVSDCCADPDRELHTTLLEKVIAHHASVVPASEIVKALS
jgi:nicotinamidase-related amidase